MDNEALFKEFGDIIARISNKKKEYYEGTVVEVLDDNKRAKVKIIGGESIYTFLNKTHEILSNNDNVRIKAINGNLSNGYIALRYGLANEKLTSNEGGTSNHSELSNLSFEKSGHTGFASSTDLSNHIGKGGVGQHPLATGSVPGFTSNDYTTTEKNKLASISSVSVINNLTSTSTTSALSAYQGKVLNDTLTGHTTNNNIHVSSTDRLRWDANTGGSGSVGIEEAPVNDIIYGRKNTLWTETVSREYLDNFLGSFSTQLMNRLNGIVDLPQNSSFVPNYDLGLEINASKAYIFVEEAPMNNIIYGRKNGLWIEVVDKDYVDNNIIFFANSLQARLTGVI